MNGLTIYKASAGSGKTHQLTGDYLKLVFQPGNHFRHILAVTFTNKATSEMRERILASIYQLTQGRNDDYGQMLMEAYGYSPVQLKTKATDILNDILHHYSFFNVSTIDSFFQGIIKSFAREMGLNHGFNLELDMKGTIEKAIDQLFDQFTDEKEVNGWLAKYAFERMQDGKTWDVQKSLGTFAGNTFSEGFYSFGMEQMEQLSDMQRFVRYKDELDQIINKFMDKVHRIALEAQIMMKNAGLDVGDFSYKESGPAGFLIKHTAIKPEGIDIPGIRAMNACKSADAWTAQKAPLKSVIVACAEAGLMQKMDDLVTLLTANSTDFYTAREIRKNLNPYALSARIYKQLIDYCNQQDIFLLGLATPFLSKMIGNDDAPFIYEKTGNYIHHFMIDEFQDTSELNWHNFLPLLTNSLSQGWPSLIVGDVKQAIYRWRNGNWALLDHVVQQQLGGFGTQVIDLPYNYRSTGNIIKFNNWFFRQIHAVLGGSIATEVDDGYLATEHLEMFNRTFGQATQQLPDKGQANKGHVSISMIDEKDKDLASNEVARRVIEQIDKLIGLGYQPGDIAILVRRNTEGAFMASKLMEARMQNPGKEANYRFVSNDSIFLGSSGDVQLIIAGLKFLIEPSDNYNKGQLIWHYFNRTMGQQTAIQKLQVLAIADNETILENMPEAFKLLVNQFKYLSLTSLINRLVDTLTAAIPNLDTSYLEALEDEVYRFNQAEGSNLQRFIEWWDEKGQLVPISLNEAQNAIRIMTIHKAKGLQFKIVFLPFAQWDLNQKKAMLWCQTDREPFNTISPVPIAYSNKMSLTIFKKEYYNEKFLSLTDNLNVLYVALTRAVDAMFVYGQVRSDNAEKKQEVKNVVQLFSQMISHTPEDGIVWNESDKKLLVGELEPVISKMDETPVFEPNLKKTPATEPKPINIKKHAATYFSNIDGENNSGPNQGSLLHHIFEYILYSDQVEIAVDKVIREGLILRTEKQDWIDRIQKMISQNQVTDWFKNHWQVYTEQSIMLANGEIKRPDRVITNKNEIIVIDYKFVKNQQPVHLAQVKEYIEAISSMGELPVKGYVWYALREVVVEV